MKLRMKQIKLKNGKKNLSVYRANKYKYDFQQYKMIRSFGKSIYTGKTNIDEAEMDQSNLLKNLIEFNDRSRPRTTEGKDKRRNTFESLKVLYEGREC